MITSNDLSVLFGSNRRDAQSRLPHLVQRLLFSTCADHELGTFSMPSGDDIRLKGWDGRVSYTGVAPFVPTGESAWEMGVGANPRNKAEADYTKRSNEPLGCDPKETTFVFVTPHTWSGKDEWAKAKKTHGPWRDVRVIDGSSLATWLEREPAVALWIADRLGRQIRGLRSLDRYWEAEIAIRYDSNIAPSTIIGGRESAKIQLAEFLQTPRDAICIVGETVEEAVSFAAATCKQLGSENATESEPIRLIFLSDPRATEHLASLSQTHVVILTDPSHYPAVRSEALDHLSFVIPEKRGARTTKSREAIELGPLVREAITTSLTEAGFQKSEAQRIAGESKGSLQAVLWMIAEPEHGALDWANGRPAAELAPLVLAGQWTANDHPDHEVLATLAQREYPEIKQTISEWSGPGNPLERRGTIWDWKAWAFAWSRLAPALQRDDINRYFKIAEEVLGTADPALELPQEDRWLANVRGKIHKYSPALREGLVHSLALLALNGELLHDTDGQAAVNHFVKKLLTSSPRTTRWISLARWLPDLAEAAPDEFLDALEQLSNDPDAIREFFTEGGMFGSNPHTHILWALERLAWSKEHFGRVVQCFAQLAKTDPGGNLSNRPAECLRRLLLPWLPATGASVEDRIQALSLLFEFDDEVAWRCGTSLLPQSHDSSSDFAPPQWRAWAKEPSKRVTGTDYWLFQEQLVTALLDHVGSEGNRWATLIDAATDFRKGYPDLCDRVISAVNKVDLDHLDREDRFILWETTRALVSRHESASDHDWSLKGSDLEIFIDLRDSFTPTLKTDRDRWLFTQWPEVLREYDLTAEERNKNLSELRTTSILDIRSENGFGAILTWAEEVDDPDSLGATLASLELTTEEEREVIYECLLDTGSVSERPPKARLARGFISQKTVLAGPEWASSALDLLADSPNDDAKAFFIQALQPNTATWNLLENQSDHTNHKYWTEVFLWLSSVDEIEYVLPKLLEANRPCTVIRLVAGLVRRSNKTDGDDPIHSRVVALARESLNPRLDHLPKDEVGASQNLDYEIGEVLNYLEDQGEAQEHLAKWEWYWFPLIHRGRRGARALQAEISDNPELFVELLKFAYHPETDDADAGDTPKEVTTEDRNRADLAHSVLDAWTRLPGLANDATSIREDRVVNGLGPITPTWTGSVDQQALDEWIKEAIRLATDVDRLQSCMCRIGRLLAHAPADPEGDWPCTEVCKVIEDLRSEDLERCMKLRTYNRRGVRQVTGDGAQEARIAAQFRAWCETKRITYPRTGAMLRRLAEDYESEAKDEIERGRLDEYDY